MIVSKPKSSALISLGIFTVLCFAIGGYALRAIINNVGMWYHYLAAILFLSVAAMLVLRQLLTYKIIYVGENKIKVTYPIRFKTKELNNKDIMYWKEEVIKTKNAPFKQLEIKFDGFLLKLSIQENTNYEQIKKYLKKRVSKKEVKNSG